MNKRRLGDGGEGGLLYTPRLMTYAYNTDIWPTRECSFAHLCYSLPERLSYEERPPASYGLPYLPYNISPLPLPVLFNTFADGVGVSP